MGGANFAASFAAPYGGKLIKSQKAGFLFIGFVALGAVLLGKNVAVTLGQELVPQQLISSKAIAIIFFSAGLSMFVSNLMKIPQSTSLVTVAAITGVGVYYGQLNLKTLYFLFLFWTALPVLSYFLTHILTGLIYPPRKINFWIYERFINHQERLKTLVIALACYNAFAVGTNNVANVVGPLMGPANALELKSLLIVFALIFGAGAFIFIEPIKTAGNKIIPLGLLTASIISLVSGTLMLFASAFGIPQSFVMLKMGAIFAVSSLKDGRQSTFQKPLTKRTLYTWTINPIITFFVSLGLSHVIIG
jgi:sulfate permease